eukprot:SAG31_NODE_3024_length_4780_cov_2.631275_2_plen_179_part_00
MIESRAPLRRPACVARTDRSEMARRLSLMLRAALCSAAAAALGTAEVAAADGLLTMSVYNNSAWYGEPISSRAVAGFDQSLPLNAVMTAMSVEITGSLTYPSSTKPCFINDFGERCAGHPLSLSKSTCGRISSTDVAMDPRALYSQDATLSTVASVLRHTVRLNSLSALHSSPRQEKL